MKRAVDPGQSSVDDYSPWFKFIFKLVLVWRKIIFVNLTFIHSFSIHHDLPCCWFTLWPPFLFGSGTPCGCMGQRPDCLCISVSEGRRGVHASHGDLHDCGAGKYDAGYATGGDFLPSSSKRGKNSQTFRHQDRHAIKWGEERFSRGLDSSLVFWLNFDIFNVLFRPC